ncbi:hypothetical protein Tco_0928671 [Tanacetum coccineum]
MIPSSLLQAFTGNIVDPQLAHCVPHPSLHCGSRYIPLLCEPDVRSCPMGPVSSWKFRWDIFIPVSFLNFHGHLISKETGQPCRAKRS